MATQPSQFDRQEREVEFSRALAFSDGVFAFAITLLVTTIDVPDLSGPDIESQLLHQLDDLVPSLLSYFLSFVIIGLLWLRHHRLFSRIRRLDTTALVLNLAALCFVVLLPFSTEVIGRYGDVAAGTSIYALNLGLGAVAFAGLWWYCAGHDMLGEELTPAQLRLELWMRLSIAIAFLGSIPIAFVSTTAAQLSWFLVIVVQRAAGRRYAALGRIDPEDD